MISWKTILSRLTAPFKGEPGYPGPKGDRGEPCEATNVQCPECKTFRRDAYERGLRTFRGAVPPVFTDCGDAGVDYRCIECNTLTLFIPINGVLFESATINRVQR